MMSVVFGEVPLGCYSKVRKSETLSDTVLSLEAIKSQREERKLKLTPSQRNPHTHHIHPYAAIDHHQTLLYAPQVA